MMAENPPHGMYRTQAYAESHNRLLTLFLQQPSHSRVISEKARTRMRTRDFWRIAQVPDVPQVKFSGIPIRPLSHRERAFSAPPDGLFSLIIMPVPHPHMVLSAAQESPFSRPRHIFPPYPPVFSISRKPFSLSRLSVSLTPEGHVFGKIFLQYVYTSDSFLNCHPPVSASCKNTTHASPPAFRCNNFATAVCRNTVLPVILFSKTCRDRQHQSQLSPLSHAMSVV